jgi:tRNA G10  N-methylase Trm11
MDRFKQKKVKKIFEPFCGVGGIAVHLCDSFEEYIVNDIDEDKIDMLKHNLKVYGKSPNRVTCLNQDFLNVEPFQTDALIICPPWGGVDTEEYATRNLDEIMTPKLTDILVHAGKFSSNIMLQMPKQTNIQNLIRTIHGSGLKTICTVEKVMTNNRLSQLFIYLGSDCFTEITTSQLYNQIYRDLSKEKENKMEKKRVKSLLDQESHLVLSEVFLSRFPNKITYLS